MTRAHVRPILSGLAIAAAGTLAWVAMARANATIRPDVPWAGVTMAVYLALLIAWLNGAGPPRRWSHERRYLLRLTPSSSPTANAGDSVPALALVAMLAGLTVLWVLVGRMSPTPDLAAYPATAYRWSLLIMGPITAGVVEEAAYRGYMQRGLERVDPKNAIWITSLVFVLSHLTHGIGTVLLVGPGFFAASYLYGLLAQRTGSILPGMAIHAAGDFAYMFFGVLRGDVNLLFVR